jgi:hypothetical protein
MNLKEIVEQLKSCGYQCEAGDLEHNEAFIALAQKANARGTTLEKYLQEDMERGVIDHWVRVNNDGTFYIRPANTDGDTLDFAVNGNELIPIGRGIIIKPGVSGRPLTK